MSIKIKSAGDLVILRLSGKLMGGKETQQVHEQVKNEIAKGGKKFVIDLARVKWLNSQGLGVLIASLNSIQNIKGQMKISGATEKVKSLLMITRLITIFDSFDSVEDAVTDFN